MKECKLFLNFESAKLNTLSTNLRIMQIVQPTPSAKSFGLKPSATEAKAKGQKASASAEDLRPSVNPCRSEFEPGIPVDALFTKKILIRLYMSEIHRDKVAAVDSQNAKPLKSKQTWETADDDGYEFL